MRQYWDPELLAGVEAVFDAIGRGRYAVDDVASRREYGRRQEAVMQPGAIPGPAGVSVQEACATSYDGTEIPLVVYRPDGPLRGSVVVYLHGGGMIDGGRSMYEPYCMEYVAATGIPMVFPEYRLAPEHPDPAPVQDCFAALQWTAAHLKELNAGRIMLFGDSAGGGLAAGVALLARDRGGPRLAAQLLAYPMLDDRTVGRGVPIDENQIWTYDDNVTGWHALLGDRYGTDDVSIYAAPARADDLTGLPRTYVDIGTIDIFRDEAIDYAARLWQAGVSAELHVYSGAPHGFETIAPQARVSKDAISRRVAFLRSV